MNHNLYLKDPGIYKENNTYYFHDTHRKIVRDLKIIERWGKSSYYGIIK